MISPEQLMWDSHNLALSVSANNIRMWHMVYVTDTLVDHAALL